ncbi:unnamed protein product [Ectocarpus sp. CCAP 1310/34]|nr:unnamed protein product [Ectocarpus sp. CCAP 1310/34]
MSTDKEGWYGDTLSNRDKLLQVKLATGCLSAGIPLHALGDPQMKVFFDFANICMPGDSHLAKHIPVLLRTELDTALSELGDGNYTVCFDPTPYRCECFGIELRFIDQKGQVVQHVLKIEMLTKSMSARDIVGQVNDTLSEEFCLKASRCIGFMLDGCTANLLALDSLTQHIYRRSLGVSCFSHLFNNIGKRLIFPDLEDFLGKLHTLLSHSPQAKALLREIVGVADPPTPNHRWGSRFERDYLVAMNSPGVVKFIEAHKSNDEDKSRTAAWLRSELARKRDDGKYQVLVLRMQLAVLVDVGKIVTATCIFLEGDEPLLHKAFSKIEKFRSELEPDKDGLFKEDVALPTLDAVIAASIGQGGDLGATADLLKAEFQDIIPLRTYAYDKIGPHEGAERATVLKYMEAARLIDFTFMRRHKYSAIEVRSLTVFPFISEQQVDKLLAEKDDHYVAARVTDADYDF